MCKLVLLAWDLVCDLLLLTLQALFNHVGTTQEYLHHLCQNKVLFNSFQLRTETMVCDVEHNTQAENEPETKRHKMSHFENCIVMHSVLHDIDR